MTGLAGVESGEEDGTRGTAYGVGDIRAGVTDAGGGEAVEGRGVDAIFTVAAEVLAVVLGDDEEDVWFFGSSDGEEAENEDSEQSHLLEWWRCIVDCQ